MNLSSTTSRVDPKYTSRSKIHEICEVVGTSPTYQTVPVVCVCAAFTCEPSELSRRFGLDFAAGGGQRRAQYVVDDFSQVVICHRRVTPF